MPLVTAADGGGSIRIPASFVGAFGIKPTRGVVPNDEKAQFKYGGPWGRPRPRCRPVSERLTLGRAPVDRMLPWVLCTQFGPICRTAEDAAFVLDITKGYDPADPVRLVEDGWRGGAWKETGGGREGWNKRGRWRGRGRGARAAGQDRVVMHEV